MRAFICFASLAVLLAAGSLYADGRTFRREKTSDRYQLAPVEEDLGTLVSQNGETRIYRPGPSTQRVVDWIVDQRAKGDGRGGSVSDLLVIQTAYSDPTNGNLVLLIWNEETPNLSDILLSVVDENGETLLSGTVPALTGGELPGTNSIFVPTIPEGQMTFVLEGDGDPSMTESTMMILPDQPFADVENFSCAEGATNDVGNCDMFLTWDTPTPLPTYHLILLDEADDPNPDPVLGQTGSGAVDSVNAGLVLPDLLPPNTYEATILGFLLTPEPDDNLYRSGRVSTACTLECSDLTCLAPIDLRVCQSSYSVDDADQLRISWTNLGSYVGIDVFIDGELNQDLVPNAEGEMPELIDLLVDLPAGEHTVALQAVCEGNLVADPVEASITIQDSTPHTSPIEGDLSCEFVLGDPGVVPDRTVVTWTNAEPSQFIDIFVQDAAQNVFYLGAGPGDLESLTINNSTPDDVIFLQFYSQTEEGCFGSDFFFCQPSANDGNIFVRGGCDGGLGTPQINAAVFGLNFLFGGGEDPPCLEACDTNADGSVNLADMVQTLNFLFGGGVPPAGWPDANTGACETAIENCETGLESCPF